MPNKSNVDADDDDDDAETPPVRRTTRQRTKATTATSTPVVAATTVTSVAPVVDKEASDEPSEGQSLGRKRRRRKSSMRVSKRELESINVSSESDVKTASTTRRSKRVVRKLSPVKNDAGVIEVEEDDQHHLIDCCFIRVSGEVYRRWKEVKKRLKFARDEDLVVYFLQLQSEDVPVPP